MARKLAPNGRKTSVSSEGNDCDDHSGDDESLLDRRDYLRLSAAAVSAISATGAATAASGGTGDTEPVTLDDTVTVRRDSESTAVDYRIEAAEGIVTGSDLVGEDKELSGDLETTASGTVGPDNYEDWFWFDGEIVSFELSGPAQILVNGGVVHAEEPEAADPDPEASVLGHYFPGTPIDPADVPLDDVTHFVFHSLDVRDGEPAVRDWHVPELETFRDRAGDHPDTEFVLQIGGGAVDGFADADPATFAQRAAELVETYDFDGVDIDWEYPDDAADLTALVEALRAALGADATVGVALSALPHIADRAYDAEALDELVDYATVMCYDFGWGKDVTGHNAAYAPHPQENQSVQEQMQYWSDRALSDDKLLVGIPFYGWAFTDVPDDNSGYGQPFETRNALTYSEIHDRKRDGFTAHWDEQAQAPYLYSREQREFVSHESPRSAALKSEYAAENYGGVSVWSLGQDADGALLTAIRDEVLPEPEPSEPTTLTVVGTGEAACYRFTVDGEIVSADEEASVSGSSAEDAIASETVSYEFTGQLTDFALTGDAGVYLDGEQVDPDRLVGDEDPVLPNSFVVQGDGTTSDYQFAVDGTVRRAPDLGSVEADDEVADGSVTGSVTDGEDGYRFDGDLTMLRVEGTADVRFNDGE